MEAEIAIEELESRPVVEVAAEPRLWRVPSALAAGFATASAHIESAGAEVEGMPFARYLEIDWPSFRGKGAFRQFLDVLTAKQKMRSGRFSSRPVPSGGSAIGTEIPAGRYVSTFHHGAYHRVGDTYRRVFDWAVENDVELANHTIENYVDDPSDMPQEEVRTRIWIPVA